MHRNSLPRFLDGNWSPYELSLVDVPMVPTPAQLDEIALVIGTAALDEPVRRCHVDGAVTGRWSFGAC